MLPFRQAFLFGACQDTIDQAGALSINLPTTIPKSIGICWPPAVADEKGNLTAQPPDPVAFPGLTDESGAVTAKQVLSYFEGPLKSYDPVTDVIIVTSRNSGPTCNFNGILCPDPLALFEEFTKILDARVSATKVGSSDATRMQTTTADVPMAKLPSGASQRWDGHAKVVFVATGDSHRAVTTVSESLTRIDFDPRYMSSQGTQNSGAEGGIQKVRWMCSVVSSPQIGPATVRPTIEANPNSAYPSFASGLQSPLENVCLGIALGITRQLAVNASTPIMITPIDVITAVGLLSVSLLSSRRIPHALNGRNRVAIEVGHNGPFSNGGITVAAAASAGGDSLPLVWGMVGEYAVDYYGRHFAAISKAVPKFFTHDPTLGFNVHFRDLWNYGIHLTTPIQLYRRYQSNTTKEHLAKFPHSITIERLKEVLQGIDATVDSLTAPGVTGERGRKIQAAMARAATTTRRTMAGGTAFPNLNDAKFADAVRTPDYRLYNLLVQLVTHDATLSPYLPLVSLKYVKWEQYVKSICVGVLVFSGERILNIHPKDLQFPAPTPSWHNDFVFSGPDRAPDPNLRLRNYFPDMFWTLRVGQQPNGEKLILQPGGTEQRRLAILAQPQVQLMMSQIAREQNIEKAAIEARAAKILRGIGDNINHRDLGILGGVIRRVFKALYNRININDQAMDVLFKATRKPRTAVVVIPAHRSYIDFLVLSYLMSTLGFAPPHICAGEDFLRLGKIAELMRGSGAFFMRRSFRGDRLYSGLFKEYVRHLARDAQTLEFFIEGLRSRTQKTIAPKLGILKMITDAFFEKQEEIDDVLFVPIGLSYERLLEANIYADELMGIPKPKETVANLIKSSSILKDNYGALNIHFGEPISLAAFAKNPFLTPDGFEPLPKAEQQASLQQSMLAGKQSGGSGASVAGPSGSYTPPRALTSVAWRITYEIQNAIVVTPTALLSATLMSTFDHTVLREEGVPVSQVASHVEWLRSTILHRGGKMSRHFAVMDSAEIVRYAAEMVKPRVSITGNSRVVMDSQLTTKVVLGNYANQLIHVFQDESILCAAAFGFGKEVALDDDLTSVDDKVMKVDGALTGQAPAATSDFIIAQGALRNRAALLRTLLSNELPNFQTTSPISFDSWFNATIGTLSEEKALVNAPLSDAEDEQIRFHLNTFTSFTAHQVFPYIESLYITAVAILSFVPSSVGGGTTTPPRVNDSHLAKIAHLGAIDLHKRNLSDFAQCCSKENIKNSVLKFVEMGLLHKEVSPVPTYSIRKHGQEALWSIVKDLNSFRWHTARIEDVEKSIEHLRNIVMREETEVVVAAGGVPSVGGGAGKKGSRSSSPTIMRLPAPKL